MSSSEGTLPRASSALNPKVVVATTVALSLWIPRPTKPKFSPTKSPKPICARKKSSAKISSKPQTPPSPHAQSQSNGRRAGIARCKRCHGRARVFEDRRVHIIPEVLIAEFNDQHMAKKTPPALRRPTAGAFNQTFGTRPVGVAGAKSAGKPDAPLSPRAPDGRGSSSRGRKKVLDLRHAQAYRSKLTGARVAETTRLIHISRLGPRSIDARLTIARARVAPGVKGRPRSK